MNTLVHLVDRGSDIMNTLNTESQHLENFIEAVSTYDVDKPTKKSSLIAPWLGIDRTPPGLSQRIGNYVEDFFALDMATQNKLPLTDYKIGRNYMITYDYENHQVDMLAMPSIWESIEKFLHREIKTNTQLDAGKKRDTSNREKAITSWMDDKGWIYDSGIFCPFFYNKGKNVSGLGWVDGLEWYIETFKPTWSIKDFIAMGRHPLIHKAIGLK